MMHELEISSIIYDLTNVPHCFGFQYFIDFLKLDSYLSEIIYNRLITDNDFLHSSNSHRDCVWFISRRALFNWFVQLNFRLGLAELHTLSEKQFIQQLNRILPDDAWTSVPNKYVDYAEERGLLSYHSINNSFSFPLSVVLSYFSPSNKAAALKYLAGMNPNDLLSGYKVTITNILQEALGTLTDRQRAIIIKRQGILGEKRNTLEEIGNIFSVTRERIRQIENKSWKRIWHHSRQSHFVPAILSYLVGTGGSLLLSSSDIQRELLFICESLRVPTTKFPKTKFTGISPTVEIVNDIEFPEHIYIDYDNLDVNLHENLFPLFPGLSDKDINNLVEEYKKYVKSHLTKNHKVYMCLKILGKPSHFSDVATCYYTLFPDESGTEHNIHAILLREQNGVVWIGSKGMFALEEWGFERPKMPLMDTIAQIVNEKYKLTGAPVPFIIIQAEIGKYRKYVNPNSVYIASSLNPQITQINDYQFIPKNEVIDNIEQTDNELDKILKKFENSTHLLD